METFNGSISDLALNLKRFLENAGERILILSHVDADGLCSAEILKRFLKSEGITFMHIYPAKGENAFTPDTIKRIREIDPTSLIVLDLGVMDRSIAPGRPTLFVDHHRPFGFPPEATVISSYGDDPAPPTSFLIFRLISQLKPSDELAWLAAIGTAGDLGSDFAGEELRINVRKKDIREGEILLNSAKRSSQYDIETAIDLLTESASPAELVDPSREEVKKLLQYRAEINAEVRRCRHEAPQFSWKVAVIPFESRCDIQGLIAETWRRQLKNYIVIAANFGYIEGRVAYVVRTQMELSVIDFMESIKPPDYDDHIVFGHDRAGGAIIAREVWMKLVDRMGFRKPLKQP